MLCTAGCTKSESDASKADDSKTDDNKDAQDSSAVDNSDAAPSDAVSAVLDAEKVVAPEGLGAAVAEIVHAKPHYPIGLDPLLELVPKDSARFVVVRDLDGLLRASEASFEPMIPALEKVGELMAATDDSPKAKAELDEAIASYQRLKTELRGSGFSIDKGLVFADVGDEQVTIYAATKPDALPTLLRALGAEEDKVPKHCAAIAAAPGYVMCSKDEAAITAYAPGKAAAAFRTRLGEMLDAGDVDRANVLAHLGRDGDKGAIAIITTPAQFDVVLGMPNPLGEEGKFLGKGPSPALGLLPAGGGGYWMQLDTDTIDQRADEAPFIMRSALRTLTGEVLVSAIAETEALVMLAGVNDPTVMGGLVALAGTQVDSLPKTLPDGSALVATVENITVDGKSTQALHVTVTPSGDTKAIFDSAGYKPEGWLFSAGGYAGVALGADKSVIDKLAAYKGQAMSPGLAATLPPRLHKSLVDERASIVAHVPMDGFHGPKMTTLFKELAAKAPKEELPEGVTMESVIDIGRGLWSPFSSYSFWVDPPQAERLTMHFSVSLFGDTSTEEGKAALAAVTAVNTGGDPATTYGALAKTYASSPRVGRYETRAGARDDGGLITVAMLGVMAGVAVPAFAQYMDAAKGKPELAAP